MSREPATIDIQCPGSTAPEVSIAPGPDPDVVVCVVQDSNLVVLTRRQAKHLAFALSEGGV